MMWGHTQAATTQRYSHLQGNPIAKAAAKTAAKLQADFTERYSHLAPEGQKAYAMAIDDTAPQQAKVLPFDKAGNV